MNSLTTIRTDWKYPKLSLYKEDIILPSFLGWVQVNLGYVNHLLEQGIDKTTDRETDFYAINWENIKHYGWFL